MSAQVQPITGLDEVEKLLRTCDLPVADLSSSPPPLFFGVHSGTALSAVIGLEIYGTVALLRSLAVEPGMRAHGLGRELVAFAERFAAREGVKELFLLTTTVRDYFERQGYSPRSREDAPAVIRSTQQFSDICPDTSALLCKLLAP
jgi:amino-acid N-acetyltransferase